MAGSSATYRLFGQDVSASSTLNRISGAARGAASSISSINASIGSIAVGNILGDAVQKIADLGKSAVETGLQTASSLEQASVSFETLLGSAQKAQAFISQMKDFAKRTPFETSDVISYSKALVGAGLSASHVTDTLTAWGDASGALGQTQDEFSRTMLALTQIMNRGKVQSDDLLQITEAGIPIWSIMSRALGKPVSTLQDLAQKGQLNAKEVLPALEAQMEKDYGGSMAKQSQTLAGLWSTLSDTFKLGMADALLPMQDTLKNGMTTAISATGTAMEWLGNTGIPAMVSWGQAFWANVHDPLMTTVAFVRSDVIPDLQQFAGWLGDNATQIAGYGAAVAAAFAAFKGISMVQTALSGLALLANPVGLAAGAVVALAGGFAYFYTTSDAFRGWVDDVADRALPVLNAALGYLGNLWTQYVGPALADAANNLLPRLQGVWNTLIGVVGPGTQAWLFFQQTLAVIGPVLRDIVIPALSFVAGNILSGLSIALRGVGVLLNSLVIPAIRVLAQGFVNGISVILHAADSGFSWIPGLGPKLHQAAASFDQFKNDVNTSLANIRDQSVTVSITPVTVPNSVSFGAPTAGQNIISSIFGKGGTLSGGSSGTTATPKGATAQAWAFLKSRGFTDAAAAGVIGNLMGESGLNPTALGDHGTSYGIAQWHNGRWANLNAFARRTSGSPSSLNTQLGFLMQELGQGAGGNLNALRSSNSISAVVSQMVRLFERPADPSGAIANRLPKARYVYAQMAGKGGSALGPDLGYSALPGAAGGKGRLTGPSLGFQQAVAARTAIRKEIAKGGTLWGNLHSTSTNVINELNKLRDNASKAASSAARSIVAAYQGTLVKLSKQHDVITAKLKDANTKLSQLRQARSQYISEQRQQALDTANIATQDNSHYGNLTFQLSSQIQWYRRFFSVVSQLKKMGLGSTAINQLIQAGPQQAYQAAVEILSQGKAGVGQINLLQGQLASLGTQVGTVGGDALYNAGIRAAQGLVKGLQSQEKVLNNLMTRLATSMSNALKRALGIHSPSRVFHGIGVNTAQGLIQGLYATQPDVATAAGSLVATAASPMASARMIPAQVGRGGVVNNITIQGAVDPVSTARQIKTILRKVDARGVG